MIATRRFCDSASRGGGTDLLILCRYQKCPFVNSVLNCHKRKPEASPIGEKCVNIARMAATQHSSDLFIGCARFARVESEEK